MWDESSFNNASMHTMTTKIIFDYNNCILHMLHCEIWDSMRIYCSLYISLQEHFFSLKFSLYLHIEKLEFSDAGEVGSTFSNWKIVELFLICIRTSDLILA